MDLLGSLRLFADLVFRKGSQDVTLRAKDIPGADVTIEFPSASSGELADLATVQTLTNKTVDADSNTIRNLETDNLKAGVLNTDSGLAGAADTQLPSALAVKTYVDNVADGQNEASEISYDNSTSGLTATEVQSAIDEVEGRVDTAETNITTNASGISTNASGISTNAGDITTLQGDLAGKLNLDGTQAMTGDLNLDSNNITNVGAINSATIGGSASGDITTNVSVANFSNKTHTDLSLRESNLSVASTISYAPRYVINNNGTGTIDEVTGGTEGQVMFLTNNSGSNVVISNEANGSGNRIVTGSGADFNLADDSSVILVYGDSRWYLVGGAGGEGGGLTVSFVTDATAPATASENVHYLTSTGSAAYTINLPANPTPGATIRFTDYARTWATNNLTIGRNGNSIDGSATDLVLDVNDAWVQFMYNGAGNWVTDDPTVNGSASYVQLASETQEGLVSTGNQSLGAGEKYFAGNVGIGTTSPSEALHIEGGNSIGMLITRLGVDKVLLGDNGASDAGSMLLYDSAGVLKAGISAGDDSYVTGGNLGVGTLSPDGAVHISATNNAQLKLQRTGTATAEAWIWAASNNLIFGNDSGGSPSAQLMTIETDTGNVGVGTSSPGSATKLQVDGKGLFTGGVSDAGDGTPRGVHVGYNTSSDFGFVAALQTGVAARTLALNPEGGNVGIGTTTPTAQLHVRSKSGSGFLRVDAPSGQDAYLLLSNDAITRWRMFNDASQSNRLTIQDSSGGASGVYMDQNDTSWTGFSDERFKTEWQELSGSLAKVNTLRAGTYKFTDDPAEMAKKRVGLIAQDVQAVLPEACNDNDPEKLGVRYTEIIPLLTKAIQELSTKLDAAEARIATLEGGQ